MSRNCADVASLCSNNSVVVDNIEWIIPNIYTQPTGNAGRKANKVFYSELLSRTSQQLTKDLADRKQHYDSLFGLLQVIPPELQLLQSNISEVLHFVPTINNTLLQLQHHNNSWFFPFLLSYMWVFTKGCIL